MDARAPAADDAKARARRKAQRRAAFLRETVRWHWISAAICLIGMLLFAVTGITLNHAGAIQATPRTVEKTGRLPEALLPALQASQTLQAQLPSDTRAWLKAEIGAAVPAGAEVEWSEGEAYVGLPGPGRDGWVTIDTQSGDVAYERTDRGWIAYLNDLHKGRNTGPAWAWFIDIFALGCVVFCATGLILLQLHSHARRSTWPLVGAGLVIPLLLAILFIH